MDDSHLYEALTTQYKTFVPSRFNGMVVVWLYEKVELGDIGKNFTYSDIKMAVREVTVSLNVENQPYTESVLRSLSHHFLEILNGERFTLTEYAKKFVKLVDGKLNSPHKHFPLRQSFEQYASFKAADIESIGDFESWFKQGFDNTTKQTILDHLESLSDEVRCSLNELNQILFAENEKSALDTAREFTTTFSILGDKANEISDTLTLDTSLKQEIQTVVDMFYARLEAADLLSSDVDIGSLVSLESDYQRAIGIQKNIHEFFKTIKHKLDGVKDKIIFASRKLNELQEHFKYQSRFKVNLRKMLTLVLEESRYTKKNIELPDAFPLKSIPYEGSNFIELPYYSSFVKSPNTVIQLPSNRELRQAEELRMEGVLSNQERISELVEYYKALLKDEKTIDFKEHFHEISEVEGSIDIALQVGFQLFQFAKGEGRYFIDVRKPLAKQLENWEIVTWDMKIHQK